MKDLSSTKKPQSNATLSFALGAILLCIAILITPMNIRDVAVIFNRSNYVRDHFEAEYLSQSSDSHTFGGHIVSTGEAFSTENEGIFVPQGLALLQQLKDEKRLEGYRFPVWYLPAKGFWAGVGLVSDFRVLSAEQLGEPDALRGIWLVVGCGIWLIGIFLVRRAIRQVRG